MLRRSLGLDPLALSYFRICLGILALLEPLEAFWWRREWLYDDGVTTRSHHRLPGTSPWCKLTA